MSDQLSRREFLKIAGGFTTALGLSLVLREKNAVSDKPTSVNVKVPHRNTKVATNVLLIVLDTVRAKSMSLYGYTKATTPELEKISSRGTLFRTAISPSSWTLPAHASMFTGQWPHRLSTHFLYPLDKTYPVLAEVMKAQGYATAGFAANTVYCSRELGLSRGFEHYEDYRLTLGQMVLSEALTRKLVNETHLFETLATYENFGRKNAEMVNHDFLKWLGKQNNDRPFFAFVNYFDAHAPYLLPPEIEKKYGLKRPYGHIKEGTALNPPPELSNELNLIYDGTIEYLDQQIASLFESLDKLGYLENTLVIITSDHGEAFGEHGMLTHANSLYLEHIQVPFFIFFPKMVPMGHVCETPVSLRNIPATVLDLVGIPNQAIFPGYNLSRLWLEGAMDEEILYSHNAIKDQNTSIYKYSLESIVYKDFHYILPDRQDHELYNIRTDPGELQNIIHEQAYADIATQYTDYLRQVKSS